MAYKTQPYMALGILGKFWRSYEIEGEVLRIKTWLAGPIEVPLPPSAVEVKQGPLRKMLGLGDVVVRAMDGKEYVCDKVANVSAFVSALRNPATAGKTGADGETGQAGGKDGSAVAKGDPQAGAGGKSVTVKFATGQSLEQHKAFFATCAVGSSSLIAVAPELRQGAGVTWKKVAEWDASHVVSKRGDERISNPELVAWSPNGTYLVTACGAFEVTQWFASGGRIRQASDQASYGSPRRFFWSPNFDFVLLEAETAQNT